jgi:hypothetical protein
LISSASTANGTLLTPLPIMSLWYLCVLKSFPFLQQSTRGPGFCIYLDRFVTNSHHEKLGWSTWILDSAAK